MIIYAYRCDLCCAASLLTQTERELWEGMVAARGEPMACPSHFPLPHAESPARCSGHLRPFAQWSAEAIR